ncbi:MAG: hypothetical protein HFH34_06715 [Eubacterium sp.]|nr:hypothetical protein [Eubacterium sp.]
MAQVYVKYNPYRLRTQIGVNGHKIETDSTLYKIVKGKRMQEWIGGFPEMLKKELNTQDLDLEFCGMDLDWDDFEDAFRQAAEAGIVRVHSLRFTEGKSDDAITEKIVEVFSELQDGPLDDFRDPRLSKAFDLIQQEEFPVNVIATMSAGKSTLINALLRVKLMPSKTEACTATITEILDTDAKQFSADVFTFDPDHEGGKEQFYKKIPQLTYDIMNELNENASVSRISAEGNIPFLDSGSMALMLVDTPGPNNAQNTNHKNITYRAINNDSNNLILYVLNGTQLSTEDDASLLEYVAKQIQKGGKQVRDRFLFVINKMDGFDPDEENIAKAILSAKDYLSKYGIDDPLIFPCSAFTALNIRTHFTDLDIDSLTREQERKLPSAARDTLPMIDKFIDYEQMHLEQYSTLSPSAQRELDYRLQQAQERGDTKEQALIHCGICSIEAAITAYVKKYARTKKVKDLVETFEELLESNQILAKAKEQVATDERAAKECAERAAHVKAMIADGKEAEVFKKKIQKLSPMASIEAKAEKLTEKAAQKVMNVFRGCGDNLTSRDEAKRLVCQFANASSEQVGELTAELESAIRHEVIDTGEKILKEYQDKLEKIDDCSDDQQLEFDTVDLIKGALANMKENVEIWGSDQFAAETVDDVGEVEYETRTYYAKVGQEAEEIIVGSHEEKIGTRKVKSGSHREKVGTRKVKNPAKAGFFGWFKFWEPSEIEQDIYQTVDDYRDEDIYKTVMDYKTVMRDVFEQKEEKIEKFSVKTDRIMMGLVSKFRTSMNQGVKDALDFARNQVSNMKRQFMQMFDELDRLIAQKYEELEKCASDQKVKEEKLRENKRLLKWIEDNRRQIDEILDM